jgi:16S rRNA C967 or C1407 C5-methylase (RsmB/RsmF family)/NOL1/NOP2/fmu family ribosome biogenesis protein
VTDPSSEAIETVAHHYGALSGNAAAFAASLAEPLPQCVWANPLRLSRQELSELFRSEKLAAAPVPWSDHALRLPVDFRPGLSWLYRAGLMQIQEEAALLSVRLLDPRPGERILDLCAAPGNKTAQIATALGNGGTVIANDINVGRLAPLHAAISRLGLMNVTTTARTGTTYPAPDGFFDRVLADVPCSGEGTIRKGFGKHQPVPADFRQRLMGTQRALLRRAIDLCRPGGRIVYSTCTFAPEENEGVVDHILRERPGDIRIIGMTIEGLATSPGLTQWQETSFHPDLAKAHRLWPHLTNTGGFFAVLLERTGGPEPRPAAPAGERLSSHAKILLNHFTTHYGLPENIFADLQLVHAGNRLRLLTRDHARPETPPPVVSGLTLTRDRADRPKLSTQAALTVGAQATRNVIDLDRGELDAYFEQDEWAVDGSRLKTCDGPGHVMIRHAGHPLGIAALRNRANVWIIDSLFPKGWG